jgi:hypothetical protein
MFDLVHVITRFFNFRIFPWKVESNSQTQIICQNDCERGSLHFQRNFGGIYCHFLHKPVQNPVSESLNEATFVDCQRI